MVASRESTTLPISHLRRLVNIRNPNHPLRSIDAAQPGYERTKLGEVLYFTVTISCKTSKTREPFGPISWLRLIAHSARR